MLHKHGGDIYSYKDIRDFSANINFRGMPDRVRTEAMRAVEQSVHYPDPGYRTLRSALAGRENEEQNRFEAHNLCASALKKTDHIRPEQIICGNGAAELLFALAAARRPKRAVVAAPSFFEYEQALTAFGCQVIHHHLKAEEAFRLDETFSDMLDDTVDLVVLGNPNNPTGRLIERDVLQHIMECCRRFGIFLVLDESFLEFLTEQDRACTLSGVSRIAEYDGLFVLKSFTKMYAMPGLRFGYGITSNLQLLGQMRSLLQPWNVSLPAAYAAAGACEETAFARESAIQVAANRALLKTALEETGYHVCPSNTNFLLFQGDTDLKEYCAERGYLIRKCDNFPGLDPSWFRICVRSREENEQMLAVLKQAKQRGNTQWQK